jgi:hypothetical protein
VHHAAKPAQHTARLSTPKHAYTKQQPSFMDDRAIDGDLAKFKAMAEVGPKGLTQFGFPSRVLHAAVLL